MEIKSIKVWKLQSLWPQEPLLSGESMVCLQKFIKNYHIVLPTSLQLQWLLPRLSRPPLCLSESAFHSIFWLGNLTYSFSYVMGQEKLLNLNWSIFFLL